MILLSTTCARQQPRSPQSGFSLIEVLVSLAIFAIVVTMSVGTMIVMIDANTKAQFTQSIVSNASFALDSMTRDIRTGSNYICSNADTNGSLGMTNNDANPRDCTAGRAFAFTEAGGSLTGINSNDNRIAFRLEQNSHGTGIGAIERKLGEDGDWQAITAATVNVTNLTFTVRHADNTDDESPLVIIDISGEGVADFQDTEFSLRTTVTQRALDI